MCGGIPADINIFASLSSSSFSLEVAISMVSRLSIGRRRILLAISGAGSLVVKVIWAYSS